MYARTTTVQAETSSIDKGIAYVRDTVMPGVTGMKGARGLSLVVDRKSGRCIATTSWDTEEAMRATASAVQSLREDASRAFGGTIDNVEEWEIAILHREHETMKGTCVRVTWLRGDPSLLDSGIDTFRDDVLPQVEQLDGFCSASLLVDRATGRLAGATAWDTRAAMEKSRDGATKIRTSTASKLEAQVEDVREFELALAHLRVPELV